MRAYNYAVEVTPDFETIKYAQLILTSNAMREKEVYIFPNFQK